MRRDAVNAAIAAYLATHGEPGNIVTPALPATAPRGSHERCTARPRFSGKGSTKFGRFTPGKGMLS
jgi:hypothetical protein